jgi:ATP-binding cassette, subfamily B, bacterial
MKIPPKNVTPARGATLLWEALRRHRRDAILGVSAGLLWSLTRLVSPVFVRRGIDLGIRAANVGALGQAVFGVLALGCLGATFAGFRRYCEQPRES